MINSSASESGAETHWEEAEGRGRWRGDEG